MEKCIHILPCVEKMASQKWLPNGLIVFDYKWMGIWHIDWWKKPSVQKTTNQKCHPTFGKKRSPSHIRQCYNMVS